MKESQVSSRKNCTPKFEDLAKITFVDFMKNILVTGGAGFIGSNFSKYVLEKEKNVHLVVLDALTYAGNYYNLIDLHKEKRFTFLKGNIRNQELIEKVLEKYSIDTVVNFAAETHVDRSIINARPFIETNIQGTACLLDATKKIWNLGRGRLGQMRFHHVSTDEVYGALGTLDNPFVETLPDSPNSPYAASKAASEHIVNAYFNSHGIPATITNCSNNYGPFQYPEKLIPLIITNALYGKPLPLYCDGGQIRDWLYVLDHCEAILLTIKHGELGQKYNVGGNNQTTNFDLTAIICDLLDKHLPNSLFKPHKKLIRFVADRPGHDRRYAMDTTKIYNKLGWIPKHSLLEGLEKTIVWYLNNPAWVSKIREDSQFDWKTS